MSLDPPIEVVLTVEELKAQIRDLEGEVHSMSARNAFLEADRNYYKIFTDHVVSSMDLRYVPENDNLIARFSDFMSFVYRGWHQSQRELDRVQAPRSLIRWLRSYLKETEKHKDSTEALRATKDVIGVNFKTLRDWSRKFTKEDE